jgi:hypothetical protein
MSDDEIPFKKASDAQFDIPDMYKFFYETRHEVLFEDFTFEEFVQFLKDHT